MRWPLSERAARHQLPDRLRARVRRPALVAEPCPHYGIARHHEFGLEDIFRAEVSTGHRVTTIEFDARLLDAHNPRAVAGSVLRSGADRCCATPADADLVEAIAAVVSLALQEGPPRLEWIAAKLGLSPRSLQRKLANSGTTYLELLERVLGERARSLIGSTRTPIIEIALSLGYSDAAHFNRAFKRWTGVLPSDYRRNLA